ncbi:uncharacterized protein LOC105165551 [Sesamum indicum]|uniref:Uncharacterized protein LOC105165551 n=1 Tax=Sesamum indicum TaxID=4182 RepID=A0A6I9TDZ0_SESIN|nr:uncharacterized protein LOC105165551 [Sesamum indicum]
MIVNCGAVLVQWRPFSRMKTVCLASTSATAEQLRQQLDNLHKEADNTRAKANNARLRLMRLSEAVEKLRRQAAVSVQTGKENDARELLFQKKKVMQAMEKLKSRIELFDELAAKLNEAITMKESLLISNMALDLEVSEIKAPTPIRIVSPVEGSQNDTDDSQHLCMNNLEFPEDQELQVFSDSQGDIHAENELTNHEKSFIEKKSTGPDSVQSPRDISTFEEFMDHLDQQLNKIEEELETCVRFSNVLLERKEKPEYSKVQHAIEILEGVRHTRERIAAMKQTK